MDTQESRFIEHIPCPAEDKDNPGCGSSDANARYSDGHEHCHVCGRHTGPDGEAQGSPKKRKKMAGDLIPQGECVRLEKRKLDEETTKKFGYFITSAYIGKEKQPVQVANYYDADGNLVAQKVRGKDKAFSVRGDLTNALPFGAHAFQKTGKKLVITEGEIDAQSVAQAQGLQWPAVSIPCGADSEFDHNGQPLKNPGKKIKAYFGSIMEYLAGFEEIILMFDSDHQGVFSAKCAAEVIGPRAKIASLPLKDANEMLVAGREKELVDAIWRAKPWRPDGMVTMSDQREEARKPLERGRPWFFEGLTEMTLGKRDGEVVTLGAGTGSGKTTLFLKEVDHTVRIEERPVGLFFMEQTPKDTSRRLIGNMVNRQLHLPDSCTQEEFDGWWEQYPHHRVHMYDGFGSADVDRLVSLMEYLFFTHDVTDFFLDHLTALVAEEEDERKALDRIMKVLAAKANQHGWTLLLISHLRRPEKGVPHEEGGRVTQAQFRGSNAIGMWSHTLFGLERNSQAEDKEERSITCIRCLKNRYYGEGVGETRYYKMDRATGDFVACEKPSGGEHVVRRSFDEADDGMTPAPAGTDEEDIPF